MAGFCLEIRAAQDAHAPPLRPVDLGGSDREEAFSWGAVRLAWKFRDDSGQWWTREHDGTLAWIEGQPDRYPEPQESLADWLASGRWGSFRGVEIRRSTQGPPETLVFVDPLGTRPLYLQHGRERVLVSDKLSTIALNDGGAEIHWPALLEAMALGSLYSYDTTLCGVEELPPGGSVAFRGTDLVRRARLEQPADGDLDGRRVRSDPAGTLLAAMKKAVAETWADPQMWLLLSGGLDSRFVLALAGPGRKAMTLGLYDNETGIARQVAACCQADFRVFPQPRVDFLRAIQLGVPVGGAMHDAHFFNHLGLGVTWRAAGIAAVTHAYLFDTLLKGYFLLPAGGFTRSGLASRMPNSAKFFERISGRSSPFAADDVIALLTSRGREALHVRLAALEAGLAIETSQGLDLTFEKRVLERISRQIHYGTLIGWCEELDVASPIFHPALWSWHRYSRARDRWHGRAFIEALLALDHDIVRVIDSNTEAPPRVPKSSWRDSIRQNRFYQRFLQPFRRSLAGASDEVSFPSGLGARFREQDAMCFLSAGIDEIRGHEWFDEAAIEECRQKFAGGQDRYFEPLLACASAGRWRRIVRDKTIAPVS
jgi:hypothetical protein